MTDLTPDHAVSATVHDVVDPRKLGWSRLSAVWLGVVVVGAFVVPFVVGDYLLTVLTLALIYAIVSQSWNLTLGFLGIWNFAQLALYAVGGYAGGMVTTYLGLSPWLALPVGAAAAAVANLIIALPAVRMRGVYVALLTFSFSEVLRNVILADQSGFTGGVYGLSGVPGLFDWLSEDISSSVMYWFCLVLCIATGLVIRRIMQSPFGSAIHGLRDSTRYAASVGINVRIHFLVTTTIAAAFAGLAGVLYTCQYGSITPTVLGFSNLSLFLFMILVGGWGTYSGPVIGTFAVVFLGEYLKAWGDWRFLVLSVILLIFVAVQPRGLVHLAKGFSNWVNQPSVPHHVEQQVEFQPESQTDPESPQEGREPA